MVQSEVSQEYLVEVALLPPVGLQDMRKVYHGDEPVTDQQVAWKRMLLNDPKGFMAELRAQEKDWRLSVAKVIEAQKAQGPQVGASAELSAEGLAECTALAKRWLRDNAEVEEIELEEDDSEESEEERGIPG